MLFNALDGMHAKDKVVNEAANEHIGITTSEGETWTK